MLEKDGFFQSFFKNQFHPTALKEDENPQTIGPQSEGS